MSTVFAERPHYFEGQYLGAEDLEMLLAYLREQQARHVLGAHTLGIVAGIDLANRADATGAIEYFLTPGVATDGYGRAIVVVAPYKLDPALFAQQPSGLVNIWIRYEEASAGGVRKGFETCDAVDAYSRVSESFAIEVGLRNTIAQREAGVAVADQTYGDARDALGTYLPSGPPGVGSPIACDASVPAQLLPQPGDPDLWLIPVGRVPWTQGSPGTVGAANDTVDKQSLLFRRQAGVVAESIIAANGLLRLRTRWIDRVPGQTNDQLCQSKAPREADLVRCNGRMGPSEPIWLDEHSRFRGDARFFGTRIEWQESLGTDYLNGGVPLAVRRRAEKNEQGGQDLQMLLGTGVNRFVIGAATAINPPTDPCRIDFNFTPGVIVQSDAKVGIGTEATQLQLPLTIRTTGNNGDALGLQAADGTIAWQINLGPGKTGLNFAQADPTKSSFFIGNNGDIGVGTASPAAKLDIQQVPAAIGTALGAGKWLQVGSGGDAGRIWFQYGPQLAPLQVMSDLDDPPRIQFQQIGNAQEDAPQFQSWIGHARSLSSDIAVIGGNVGIGTVNISRTLHAEGSEIHSGGLIGGFSFASRNTGSFVEGPLNGERWVWYADGGVARLWSGSDKVAVTPQGKMGIGTLAPNDALDVRGNVRLGDSGNYFALGALGNWRVIAGQVPASGNASGAGWQSTSGGATGVYGVTFPVPFGATPIVVCTPVDAPNDDNTLCVRNVSGSGFTAVSMDVDASGSLPQDSAFNFIALGPRA
jgi:hypothetical protein